VIDFLSSSFLSSAGSSSEAATCAFFLVDGAAAGTGGRGAAETCRREKLTYTDVCWRMPTYADVCCRKERRSRNL
jgi:hypothetical protein